jgi:hypothetical protein
MAKKVLRFHNIPPRPATHAHRRRGRAGAGDPRRHGLPGDRLARLQRLLLRPDRVRRRASSSRRLREAWRFGPEALVERFVRGKEITVGILGDRVLGSCEIAPPREVFDLPEQVPGRHPVPPARPRQPDAPVQTCSPWRSPPTRRWAAAATAGWTSSPSDEVNDFVLEVNHAAGDRPPPACCRRSPGQPMFSKGWAGPSSTRPRSRTRRPIRPVTTTAQLQAAAQRGQGPDGPGSRSLRSPRSGSEALARVRESGASSRARPRPLSWARLARRPPNPRLPRWPPPA